MPGPTAHDAGRLHRVHYASLIYANAGFDLARDFVPISAIDHVQSVLLVNPTRLDLSSLQQFLAAARANPDSIDMASGGPEVPTFDEAGLSDFRAISWDGVFAPKATPEPVLDRMHAAIRKALGTDKIKQQWAERGARVELESRADFAAFVVQDGARWSAVIKAAGIKPK